MLLRSSSTPLFGSLLTSFHESSSHSGSHFHDAIHSPLHHSITMLPSYFHHPSGSVNLAAVSGNSSPISPSITSDCAKTFRRVQSEGNLDGLAATYKSPSISEAQPKPNIPRVPLRKTKSLALETIPSFSSSLDNECEEDDDDKDDKHQQLDSLEGFTCLASAIVTEHLYVEESTWSSENQEKIFQEMYVGGGGRGGRRGGKGGGGGDNSGPRSPGGDGEEINQTEQNYKRMLNDEPSNPMILRNYAEFLKKTKRDLRKAEEYCSRAILADPTDGEVLALYAQLSWNLHHNEERATDYFNRASQASPENSVVHAAYAQFLWEVEDEERHCHAIRGMNSSSHHRLASTNA